MFGIPVPNYELVNREVPYEEVDYFVEQEDYVEIHGKRFWKPFVEKPIEGTALFTLSYVIYTWQETVDNFSLLDNQ